LQKIAAASWRPSQPSRLLTLDRQHSELSRLVICQKGFKEVFLLELLVSKYSGFFSPWGSPLSQNRKRFVIKFERSAPVIVTLL
jgi:hypothetical protein